MSKKKSEKIWNLAFENEMILKTLHIKMGGKQLKKKTPRRKYVIRNIKRRKIGWWWTKCLKLRN